MGLPGPLPGPQAWNPPPRPHPPASRGADPSSGPAVWPQHSSHSRCPRHLTTGTPVAPSVSEDPLSLASKAVGEAVRRGPRFRGQRLRGGLLGSSHFRGAPQTSESSCTAFHAMPQAGRRRVRPAHPLGAVRPATSLASGDGHREPLVRAARSQRGREGQRPAERVDGWLEGRGDARARGGGERAGRLTAGPRRARRARTAPTALGTRSGLRSTPRVSAHATPGRPRWPWRREARSRRSPPCSVPPHCEAEGSAPVSPRTGPRPAGMRRSARTPEAGRARGQGGEAGPARVGRPRREGLSRGRGGPRHADTDPGPGGIFPGIPGQWLRGTGAPLDVHLVPSSSAHT